MKHCLVLLILTIVFIEHSAASILNELSKPEREAVLSGKVITKQREVKDAPWPEFIIYRLMDATPLEAVGVFAAYEYQQFYIPNLKYGKVLKHISSRVVHVSYIMHIPWPFEDAKYVMEERLNSLGKDGYIVTWNQIKSNSTDISRGDARFEPYQGKTIFSYKSLVKPKSWLAVFLSGKAQSDLEASMEAIVNHTKKLKKGDTKLLKKLMDLITGAMAGKNVYNK